MYCIKNKLISSLYRVILLFICGYCLLLHFTPKDYSHNLYMLGYFTILSNIFCLLMLLVPPYTDNVTFHFFYGMSLAAILLTFFVYHFVIVEPDCSIFSLKILTRPACDLLAHYIIPILYVLYWLLFIPKLHYKYYYPLTWTLYPFLYFLVTMWRVYLAPKKSLLHLSSYPYFFLDIDKQGLCRFIGYLFGILTAVIIIGYVILLLERLYIALCRVIAYLYHLLL